MPRFVVLIFLLALPGSAVAQYAGRYTDGKDYAVYFEQTRYGLTIRPVMWSATQLLREAEKDKFVVVDRVSRGAEFRRNARGAVIGVKVIGMEGEGLELRREAVPQLPVELLLSGNVRRATEGYIKRRDVKKALDTAEQVLMRLPTKTRFVVAFLSLLSPHLANDAKFHRVHGYALVQAGDRRNALIALRRSQQLDPRATETTSALARLGELPERSTHQGWNLPFSLADVFDQPTGEEIAAVEKDWAARDLSVRGVREEFTGSASFDKHTFDVRIVSHLVHGKRHYGAILIPQTMATRSLPVIIEAKGVSPTYFPLDPTRLAAPRMMSGLASDFIYVVPGFRGETINFDGRTFTSEGDRTDALDGATDDTIALLNVALETLPQADKNRICAFGHSRGGTVAMLTGMRDKRIKCVVNWAGPTDWFYAMGTNGWTEEELWREALRTRATPVQPGGQNVERFLKHAIEGRATLRDVRHRMIASSPLYFAHRLPQSQHHYGEEDPFVPERNVRELLRRFKSLRLPRTRYEVFIHPGQGHDTNRLTSPESSRIFIAKIL